MEAWPFLMVVMIVAIVTIGKIIRNRDTARAAARGDGLNVEEAARLRAEVTRLADRVKVLERLAIDPSKRLADEIAALDHRP